MDVWMTREETIEACRKIHLTDGRRPVGALSRNGEREFLLLFEKRDRRIEPYGVLPVDGGFLQVYAR